MPRIPVAAQVLILAIVPLALQLMLLLWMADLQSQAEYQLAQAVKSKKIADGISKLMSVIYVVARHANDDRESLQKANDELTALRNDTYAELKSLAEPGTDLARTIERSEAASLNVQRVFKEVLLTKEKVQSKPLWIELRRHIKEMVYGGLLEAQKESKALAQQGMETESQLRARFHQVALFGGTCTLLLSGVIALLLAGNISRRLKRLDDNNLRLASSMPLLPVMTGADEIARIDQTFHHMAKVLEDTVRKEHLVIEGARDVICSVDRSGRVVAINPACSKMLGYPPEDLIGARLINLVSEEPTLAKEFMERLSQDAEHESIEIKLRHKEGHEVDTSWSVHWSEQEGISFCVVHDISERRAAERLRQEVMHMISHDLRTPLTTLGNVFEFLSNSESELVDKRKHYIQVGERNVERLIGLVSDLLDVEKIRSGKMTLDREAVRLDECFQACIEALFPAAESRGVKLTVDETSFVVSGDPGQLDRVIINLAGNAIKYSKTGDEVKVYAELDGELVKVTVADEGHGIPEDQLDRVFERFHQVRDEDRSAGSGLGLTICKAFIELHGGRIWAERREEKGTKFCFTVPILVAKV